MHPKMQGEKSPPEATEACLQHLCIHLKRLHTKPWSLSSFHSEFFLCWIFSEHIFWWMEQINAYASSAPQDGARTKKMINNFENAFEKDETDHQRFDMLHKRNPRNSTHTRIRQKLYRFRALNDFALYCIFNDFFQSLEKFSINFMYGKKWKQHQTVFISCLLVCVVWFHRKLLSADLFSMLQLFFAAATLSFI